MNLARSEALKRVAFLKTLPDDTIDAIASAGQERILCKGETLFSQHEACLGLLVVLRGAVKISKIDQRGRELVLGMERAGSCVAELPLFDGGNYPAHADAAEDETVILIIPRAHFLGTMERYPEIASHAVRALAVRMRKMLQLLEAQALHTVRVRLANYILQTCAGRPEFILTETNDVIAGHLGTVREVVSRTLGSFREARLMDIRGRLVTIVDARALRKVAEIDE